MATKLNQKPENATIINGAILTQAAIDKMREFQDADNELINDCQRIIADGICFLALLLDNYDHEPTQKRVVTTMTELSYVRDHFNDLRKP